MASVSVLILHHEPPAPGPLARWLADARVRNAERHRRGFLAAGAADVRVVPSGEDDTPFGTRLRDHVRRQRPAGLVVLGSGAVPLASLGDRRAFVELAAADEARALANNRFSADIVAVAQAEVLADVPALPADNPLPRWLEEAREYAVDDLRDRWRLGPDLDTPLDDLLLGLRGSRPAARAAGVDLTALERARSRVAEVAADRRAELVVAGRTSARSLAWLERNVACRVRALVEERGLRASSPLALAAGSDGRRRARPPRSALGALLDRDGPAALGPLLAGLGDAALVDTRVLLAHQLGPDERRWPAAEDRFAADLLLPDLVADPWLQALAGSAIAGPAAILLGGHTLVGPGVRLIVRPGA